MKRKVSETLNEISFGYIKGFIGAGALLLLYLAVGWCLQKLNEHNALVIWAAHVETERVEMQKQNKWPIAQFGRRPPQPKAAAPRDAATKTTTTTTLPDNGENQSGN